MTGPLPSPERIELSKADDPRDVVHRTVAALAQGETVLLFSSGQPGLAASALRAEAVERLAAMGGTTTESQPITLLVKGAGEVTDWVPAISAIGLRLARRAWPGPVTYLYDAPVGDGLFDRLPPPVRPLLAGSSGLALQVPAEEFMRGVLDLLPGPLVFRPVPDTERDDLDGFASRGGAGLVLDLGTPVAGPTTVVRINPGGWEIVTPGAVDSPTLTRMAGTIILFICTGNTCRSPMAEALCKLRLAERLGCPPSELEARGFVVLSAGIAAMSGMPAAANAVAVVKARGGSLAGHQSRKLTTELVLLADHILGMTSEHIEALLDHVPEAAPKTRVLHPHGEDLLDPVGADRETYQRTADSIESSLRHLIDSLGV